MRSNHPVTQREIKLPADGTLLSTTDIHSHITYANGAFLHASGFPRDELMGEPHNIVRHPDMPPEAFSDMWKTIRDGLPWTAVLKNRRKDGDHYWVRANAVGMRREGTLVGYMSVRTPASEPEIAAASALYADFRAGRTGRRRLERGLIVQAGWQRWRSALQLMSLRARIALAVGLAGLVPLATVAAFGYGAAGSLALLVLATILGGSFSMVVLERQVVAPLQCTLKQALAVASGEKIVPVLFNRVDEIGLLMRSVNQAGLNLRALVDDVAEQVSGLEAASQEIAAGSQDLRARTERAASSLQQTTTSMEQLTSTIDSNIAAASQVGELTLEAKAVAERAGSSMTDAISRMHDISTASRRITEIVGLIDSISFQTNILALNAAVEAARAGEQGRGFAVVAAEVRALAQRSAGAANEIKSLIDESSATVRAGAEHVESAGETMRLLVNQVESVSGLMMEIGRATVNQATEVSQANGALAGLDQSTQQNAALVEHSAAAAEALRGQAGRLGEAIGVYRGR